MPEQKLYGVHIDCDPSVIVEEYRLSGERFAAAQAKFQYLDDMEKIILAEIKLDFWLNKTDERGKKYSMALIETMALAHPDYRAHIEEIRIAREKSYKFEKEYKCEDKRLELLRSLESSVRSQLTKL